MAVTPEADLRSLVVQALRVLTRARAAVFLVISMLFTARREVLQ